MNKILFLDFDGVLFDTAIEAFHVAFPTYYHYEYCSEKHSKVYDLFKANRYLIAPAWHYFYLFQAIDNHLATGSSVPDNFYELLLRSNKAQYENFESNFFAYRQYMRNHNFQHWISLNNKYPFFDLIKNYLPGDSNMNSFILSTKDEDTISAILNFNNVSFSADRILGKSYFDKFSNKADVIREIMSCDSCSAIFIDDALEHLRGCSGIQNLVTIRNDWGYIEPEAKDVRSCSDIALLIHNFYKEEL